MIQISSVNELAYPNVVVKDASIQNYISVALLAVAIYEHVLTLPQETSHLWRRKFTLVSALVFLLKYGVLAYQGFSVVSIFVPAEATCGVLLRFTQACFLLLMVLFCVGSTLRVYALSQSTGIAITVAVLGTGQVVDNTYTFAYSNVSTLSVPSATCLSVFEFSAGVTSRLTIASRISTALADAIVITVTLKRTIGIVRDAARINIKIPVVASLLQDGTLYFLVALAMNITQVVVFETLQELYLSPFILVVTSILLSRLFLDLREAQMASGARRHTSEPTTSIFVSVIVVRTVEDAESCINIGPEQTNKGEQGLSMHESFV